MNFSSGNVSRSGRLSPGKKHAVDLRAREPTKKKFACHSTEQSPAREAKRFSANQEIPSILWNLKVHYRIHKCLPPVPILSHRIGPGPGPRLSVRVFRNNIRFYGEELVTSRPTPKDGGPPHAGCWRLLIQYIRSPPPYWRPFLHPQPDDAPCRGDKDPLTNYQ